VIEMENEPTMPRQPAGSSKTKPREARRSLRRDAVVAAICGFVVC